MKIEVYALFKHTVSLLHTGEYEKEEDIPVQSIIVLGKIVAITKNEEEPLIMVYVPAEQSFALLIEDTEKNRRVSDYIRDNHAYYDRNINEARARGIERIKIDTTQKIRDLVKISIGDIDIIVNEEDWDIISINTRESVH